VGDFIIVKKKYRKKGHYPLLVIAASDEQEIIVKWERGESSVNAFLYELATEEEIKIHKIKNMF
jgi:hypothetical protein